MARTRTGSFPIGMRHRWEFSTDLDAFIQFARDNAFEVLDVPPLTHDRFKTITDAGLRIGSTDLQDWCAICSPDDAKRRDAAQSQVAYIREVAPLGALIHFTILMPEDPSRGRAETFGFCVDGYGRLCEAIADTGARIVIEGWPGGFPHFSNLACTPDGCRRIIREVGSEALGINFDPSHLIRMGIDPVRFLEEFAPHVYHAHAKDTEILEENLYEHGHSQPATFPRADQSRGLPWRYTLPGHGLARWGRLFAVLEKTGYEGAVCIEHEDDNFIGSDEVQKRGFIAARDFLVHA